MRLTDKVLDIVQYARDEGDASAEAEFNITHETLRRYKRAAQADKNDLPDFDKPTEKTLREIAERYSPEELKAIAKGGIHTPKSNTIDASWFDGSTITFGVITDTHIGSKDYRQDWYDAALLQFERYGVDFITHVGDVTEGMSGRPGHIYELEHLGYSRQKAAAVEQVSRLVDIAPTYVISGNHDRWFIKSSGADVVQDICAETGAEFLGHDTGDILIGGVKITLWHGEDGSCFDDKTEIMTRNGWKPFSELSDSDEVATMTKDGHEFQWQRPTSIYKSPYSGDMIHFESRTVDCRVTPNHGMWTRVYDGAVYRRRDELLMPQKSHRQLVTDWHRKNAGDIVDEYSRQKWQFTKVCDSWRGASPDIVMIPRRESKNTGVKVHHYGELTIDDAAELIAWYVTEGHVRKSALTISQYKSVNPDNHQQIVELAQRIGGNWSVGKQYIRFGSMELAEWIVSECGHLSRNKYLPKWLKDCDATVLNLVLDTMIKGDGWQRNGSELSFGYRSISPMLREDFGEIAIKCGYSVKYTGETVLISKDQTRPTVNARPRVEHYDGMIYCCEVPNGLIMVRRNGKTLWTHNSYAHSYRVQKVIESMAGGTKPNILLTGHVHKAYYFFDRNIHAIGAGCIQQQTAWMRGKRLPAHPGFWIIEADVNYGSVVRFNPQFFPFY